MKAMETGPSCIGMIITIIGAIVLFAIGYVCVVYLAPILADAAIAATNALGAP